MEADQSFDEDDEDDEEEEEDVKTSKKRPASSPALKSQVSLTFFCSFSLKFFQNSNDHNSHLTPPLQKKMKMDMEEDDDDDDDEDDE